jgi:hypothetical protein
MERPEKKLKKKKIGIFGKILQNIFDLFSNFIRIILFFLNKIFTQKFH